MHLGFLTWHRKARPLAGIWLNGGEWYPGGGAKQDDVTGWGVSAGVLAHVCASGQRVHRLMLALACVCRRETLGGELQAERKRRQLDLARSRQRIAQLKVEPWSVSRRSSHDGETPERWCWVQVAGVLAPAPKRAKRCTGVAKSP
jgi:hypothetical protein